MTFDAKRADSNTSTKRQQIDVLQSDFENSTTAASAEQEPNTTIDLGFSF